MKITSLRLRQIKAFDRLDLTFGTDERKPRSWTLLLGDNASGKSTILRCLAIGMNDESSAAGLVREIKSSFVRKAKHGQTEGVIIVGLIDSKGTNWTLKTVLTPIPKTGDRVRQRIYKLRAADVPDGPFPKEDNERGRVEIDKFPWDKLFACGYGAGRSIDGREEYSDYRTVDAVYTLFRYDQPLQSPELSWRRYRQRVLEQEYENANEGMAATEADRRIAHLLGKVLDMAESADRIVLREEGIHLRYGRELLPLSDHADGYRSVTTWLLDFIAWYLLYHKGSHLDEIGGVVLVDEIEQHLHPKWQRYVIGRLYQLLPNVQFITTTHSPLCVASAADLTAEQCALVRLEFQDAGQRVVATELSLPYALRADQILMSKAFGLDETINPEVGDYLTEYRKLFEKQKLTTADEKRKKEIEKFFESNTPDLLQFREESRLTADLAKLIEEARNLREQDKP